MVGWFIMDDLGVPLFLETPIYFTMTIEELRYPVPMVFHLSQPPAWVILEDPAAHARHNTCAGARQNSLETTGEVESQVEK